MNNTKDINFMLADIRQQFEVTQIKRMPHEKRGDECYNRFRYGSFRELERDFLQVKWLADGVSCFCERRVSGVGEWGE